ncbi:uncharacterized protein LOC110845264 [Folsomia candida]|uniref:uncharacterized protein LOC110845264 n=1 Tax=Folsomia candida TaxID=158441 RepID=UPI000B905997|nr:uncharacterized protein LOC110845264 [Folsomia candida]
MCTQNQLSPFAFVEVEIGGGNGNLVETLESLMPSSAQMLNILRIKTLKLFKGVNSFRFYSYEPLACTIQRSIDASSRDWSDTSRPLFLVCLISTEYSMEGESPYTYRMMYSRETPDPSDELLATEFAKLIGTSNASGEMVFATVDMRYRPFLCKIATKFGKTMDSMGTRTWALYLPKAKADGWKREIKYGAGKDITVKPLSSGDATTVNSHWKWGTLESDPHIRDQIEKLPSAGVFSNDDLVSWGILCLTGTISALQTQESHRRRGFGELIMKSISTQMIEHEMVPFCEVELDTTASRKMMDKLGFIVAFDAAWMSWPHNN